MNTRKYLRNTRKLYVNTKKWCFSIRKPCPFINTNTSFPSTGELGYDGLDGTRIIGPSYTKSVVYTWRILDMHQTATKHIVRHMQKNVVQWYVISKFTCIYKSFTGIYKSLSGSYDSFYNICKYCIYKY